MDNIKQENIEEICFKVSKDIILPKFQNLQDDDIKYKNGADLVTSVDIEAEKELKKNLLKIIPSSNFIGEEEYALNDKIINQYNEENYCWTVDPIDGTKNFVNGKDRFAIMISLTFKEYSSSPINFDEGTIFNRFFFNSFSASISTEVTRSVPFLYLISSS